MSERPESWPPVGSIIQTRGSKLLPDGTWLLVHLTNAIILDDVDGGRGGRLPLSALHTADGPTYMVFRRGYTDYSKAWHQTLPWMNRVR